jgi:hypothetical protein
MAKSQRPVVMDKLSSSVLSCHIKPPLHGPHSQSFFKDVTLDEARKHLIEPPCINRDSNESISDILDLSISSTT